MVTPTNIPYQINSFLARTLATPRHCSQFYLPKASACALVRPTHERWKRHPHVSHLINFFLLLTTPQKEHTESLSSPMRLGGYLSSPKRSPQYSQPGITIASGESALTQACHRGCLHYSHIPYLPLTPDKCLNKQIPLLTDAEHMGIRIKRLKE